MKQLLLTWAVFLLATTHGYGQYLIGKYGNGSIFSETDTLKDGAECTFRYANNRPASWKIELSPYNENTILQTEEHSADITLKVAPPDGKNNLRTAWWSSDRTGINLGRVCAEDDAGHKDTLNLVFNVKPAIPKILGGTAKNVYYDADYDVYCDAEFDIQLQLANTDWIYYAIWETERGPNVLTRIDMESVSFSGIYNLHIPCDGLGYMVFGAHNKYGEPFLSDTIVNIMMIEDENVRNAVLAQFNRYTAVDLQKEDAVEVRKDGRDLVVSGAEVEEIRVVNLQGRVVAWGCSQRMPLPVGLPHGCYIVSVKSRGRNTVKAKVML